MIERRQQQFADAQHFGHGWFAVDDDPGHAQAVQLFEASAHLVEAADQLQGAIGRGRVELRVHFQRAQRLLATSMGHYWRRWRAVRS